MSLKNPLEINNAPKNWKRINLDGNTEKIIEKYFKKTICVEEAGNKFYWGVAGQIDPKKCFELHDKEDKSIFEIIHYGDVKNVYVERVDFH